MPRMKAMVTSASITPQGAEDHHKANHPAKHDQGIELS